jgi:hypothetical protein
VLAFLSNVFQWVFISILVPVLVLSVLGGVVFLILRGLGALGARRKKSFDDWDRDTKRIEKGEQ